MKYSIITINLNNRDGLRKTIESIIRQTCSEYEYLIIDGGSTDGSVELIKEYENKIDYWVSEPDKGIYHAMNKGILQAQGEYLNFMNSGDCFHSATVLSEVLEKSNGEAIIMGRYADIETALIHQVNAISVTLLTLLKEPFNHQATFYHRTLFNKRLYDENLRIQADWKFNMQAIIMDNCSVKLIDTIVTDYDFNGISARNRQLVQRERKMVLQELYPERILLDYERMYTEGEVLLLKILPHLKDSYHLQRIVYCFAVILLKLRSLLKLK